MPKQTDIQKILVNQVKETQNLTAAKKQVSSNLFGGIEAGGTKFVCAVGAGPDDLRAEMRFSTTTPDETIGQAIDFFQAQPPLAAVGIASFGPVDPNPGSATYGYITTTPKAYWAQTDFAGAVRRALGVPVGFDTDVNVAALGEHRWGAAQGLDTFIYLTIGTGLGGGGLVNGRLMHGLIHPEMGHIRLPHDWEADPFAGACPYHGDCLEGLAAGPALAGRWGQPAERLPADHPAWALEAHYLALALVNFICTLSPQRIVMGGGVMEQSQLFPLIRRKVQELLHGYVQAPAILEHIEQYIVAPVLGNRAGVLGAIALAQQAAEAAAER
jgi:fructokinase